MKELTIEEKARRYDEAIERAKEMIKAMTDIGGVAKVDDIQYLFPELKESEDERIKEELKKVLDKCLNVRPQIVEEKQYIRLIAWLEKQGWSEEDEARFKSCIKVLQTSDGYDTINVKWLKSIRDRVLSQPKQEL